MPRLGGVATVMPVNSSEIIYLYQGNGSLEEMPSLNVKQPFFPQVVLFLNRLSQVLLGDKIAKEYPDIIAFAFFCRRAHIEHLKARYGNSLDCRLGRGVTFHIAPSNVPTIFAYSMVTALLAGNASIVRVSGKPFAQTDIICQAIVKIFDEGNFENLRERIAIVKYDHSSEITAFLSSLCDVRIIWGGNVTINEIRKIPVPSHSMELTFADRYSFCIIHTNSYLEKSNPKKVAQEFYNDTYLYDQNACSAPRLIVWVGEDADISLAKKRFWDALQNYVEERYALPSIIAVDKLMTICRCSMELEGTVNEKMPDNLISRIRVKELSKDIPAYRCAGGSFIEYNSQDLDTLAEIISREYQTMAYIGFDPAELRYWVIQNGLCGIDRIVPVGKTADFSVVWDGYDLIYSLSRICNVG